MEADTIKQEEMKEKITKKYFRRTGKLLETILYSRNLIKGINIWVVPLVRYSEPFLKWTREEHKQMDQRTRKLMHKNKKTNASQRWRWQIMCQEMKEEEDLTVLKTVLMHQYKDLKFTLKTRRNTDYNHLKQYWQHKNQQNDNNQKTKMKKKTNSKDVLSD